jgi:microcystin-dependent protein
MGCSNCFNGCTEITSDKCVKYTGVDVPVLGIKNGDSLSYVEQAIIEFLTSTLDGTGIVLDVDSDLICDLVSGYLPDCKDLTLADLSTALVQAACSLQTQVDAINTALNTKEGDYDVGCLTGVDPGDGTHVILQAVITAMCANTTSITAIANDLSTNYVPISEVDTYIADYLESISASELIRNKMIPYVAVEYYGSTAYFNATGAGTGNWEQVYLCNGLNGTPDKRGRIPVGAVTGMGGSTLDAEVDPANPGNPAYVLNMKAGTNTVTLTANQMPSHTHAASFAGDAHSHGISDVYTAGGAILNHLSNHDNITETAVNATDSTIATGTVTVSATGGGLYHANNQPALACYYIIYIPS